MGLGSPACLGLLGLADRTGILNLALIPGSVGPIGLAGLLDLGSWDGIPGWLGRWTGWDKVYKALNFYINLSFHSATIHWPCRYKSRCT